MESLFPLVENMYNVSISNKVEEEYLALGESRADGLVSMLNGPFNFLKKKKGVELYEMYDKELYTMKGVKMMSPTDSLQVLESLKSSDSASFRQLMNQLIGPLFLDGVVLHTSVSAHDPNETLSINWMALQSTHPHVPHRDFLFLQYANVFESSICTLVWESIEFEQCQMPVSNLVRSNLRRSGVIIEPTEENSIRVSFFFSETLKKRTTVSSKTQKWMRRIVSRFLSNLAELQLQKRLSGQKQLTASEFMVNDGPACHICLKSFTIYRRKHHCRFCGELICSNCSIMRDTRICTSCIAKPRTKESEMIMLATGEIETIAVQDSPVLNLQDMMILLSPRVQNTQSFSYALSYQPNQSWPVAPLPKNEQKRLSKVLTLQKPNDTAVFSEICHVARMILECEIATISLIDQTMGYFIATAGTDQTQLPRDVLLDAHAIMSESPTIALDTSLDVRFAKNPLNLGFYVGFPLITSEGLAVGCLSLADTKARKTAQDVEKIECLDELAQLITRGIDY